MSQAPQTAAPPSAEPRRWSFGAAVLDERTRELTVGGVLVPIERRPLEVLRLLLRRSGEAVSKDEFFEAVWPGRVVTEQVLTQCISKVREALGADGPALVKSVHGYGYRLVAEVRVEAVPAAADAPAAGTPAAQVPEPRDLRVPAALVLLVLLAGLAYWLAGRAPAPPRAVAVLPFVNLSEAPGSAYFTDGLHDSVINRMTTVPGLRVISRNSVLAFREGGRALPEIAEALGVTHVVEASVQREGNRLRVIAQLVNADTGAQEWSADYDRELDDLFRVQAEIAGQIARAVQSRLTPEDVERLERPLTGNVAAYDAYLRALEVHHRGAADLAEIADAVAQLQRAIELDPGFAAAHALLVLLHDGAFWSGLDPSEARRTRMREAAQAAVRLDPALAEARLAQALYLLHGERDYAGAMLELEEARRLAPGNADVHRNLATVHRQQARWDDAIAALAAAARLDPRNEAVLMEQGSTLYALRRYSEADAVFGQLAGFAAQPESVELVRAYNRFAWTGKLRPLEEALERFASAPDPGCTLAAGRARLRAFRRDFAGAAETILACPGGGIAIGGAHLMPKEFFAAQLYRMGGDARRARPHYLQARPALERSLADRPDQPRLQIPLAFVLAHLGDVEAGRELAERAEANLGAATDALVGAFIYSELARFYASIGDSERALNYLEVSLSVPGGMPLHDVLRDPSWDPLRGEPRFRELVTDRLPEPWSPD